MIDSLALNLCVKDSMRKSTIVWIAYVVLFSPIKSACRETNSCVFLHKMSQQSCLPAAFMMFACLQLTKTSLIIFHRWLSCTAACMLLHPRYTQTHFPTSSHLKPQAYTNEAFVKQKKCGDILDQLKMLNMGNLSLQVVFSAIF